MLAKEKKDKKLERTDKKHVAGRLECLLLPAPAPVPLLLPRSADEVVDGGC
jgi:hypothetical protein